MGKTMEQVSFWNKDMKVNKVTAATSSDYLEVTSLKQFDKKNYSLYRVSDGSYVANFNNGDFIAFI